MFVLVLVTDIGGGFPIAATVVIVLIIGAVVAVLVVLILFVMILEFRKRKGYIGKLFCSTCYSDCVYLKNVILSTDMTVPEDYLGHTPLNQFDVTTVATPAQKVKDIEKLTAESRFNLKRIDLNDAVFLKLNTGYPTELITLVDSALRPRKFERGCAFYEFLCKEDISDAKEIIFMNVCVVQYH